MPETATNPDRLASIAPSGGVALGRGRRVRALAIALGWSGLFGWLWFGMPWDLRLWALGWALLAVVRPSLYWVTLALALPWFGNQPGSMPMMTLIEPGLMGLVILHQLRRAAGLAPMRPARWDAWLLLLVGWSWVTVLAQWRFIECEFLNDRWRFLYWNFMHYGTSPTFGFQAALKLTLGWGVYQALRDEPWPARRMRAFVFWLLAGGAVAAGLGLLNYVHLLPLDWWRPDNPDVARFGFRRLQSLFGHPGWLAEYLALIAPAGVALGMAAPRRWQRWAGWGLAVLFVPTMLLTMQRGGWLALAAGYAVALAAAMPAIWRSRGMRRAGLTAAAFIAGALLIGFAMWIALPDLRFRLGELMQISDRTRIWLSSWQLGRPYRWTGIGLGDYFNQHCLAFPPGHPFSGLDKVTSHNTYLHMLTERGIIGLTLFLGMLGLAGERALAGWRRSASGVAGALPLDLMLAVLGGLAAFLVYGVVQYLFYIRIVAVLFWVLLGMLAWSVPARTRLGPWERWPWLWRGVLAALLVLFAWQHGSFDHYLIPVDGKELRVGGGRVVLSVPGRGDRFTLDLAAIQPGLEKIPQVLTVTYGGKRLAEARFDRLERQRLHLTLPQGHGVGVPVVVTASRVWRPLHDSGQRRPELPEIGVLYRQLEPAGDE